MQNKQNKQNSLIQYFDSIETGFRKMKFVTVACLVLCAVVCLGSLAMYASFIKNSSDHIYVLSKTGGADTATATEEGLYKDIEVKDHVSRFHEYMFNLVPNEPAILDNMEKAFNLCDKSAYTYYEGNAERGFYRKMVSLHVTQQFIRDSLQVNMAVYPYEVKTFGKIYMIRESNISLYNFESTCRVIESGRHEMNPHGLQMENFLVTKNDLVETRRR